MRARAYIEHERSATRVGVQVNRGLKSGKIDKIELSPEELMELAEDAIKYARLALRRRT